MSASPNYQNIHFEAGPVYNVFKIVNLGGAFIEIHYTVLSTFVF